MPMSRKLLIAVIALAVPLAERAAAHPPWGITVDDRGQVYFADIDHGNHIWRIDVTGTRTSLVSGRHSHDLHLDRGGNLFVAHVAYVPAGERWESRLLKIAPSGATAIVIPPTTDRKQFWGNAFTLDRGGNVYFGYTNNPRAGEAEDESLLLKRSPGGRVTVLAGSGRGHRDGKGRRAQFKALNGLACGPEGLLYVSDEDAVRKVTPDGDVTTLARDLVARKHDTEPAGGSDHLFGLAVAPGGAVYAADHSGRRIVKITPEGRTATAATSEPPWAPTGVAVAGDDLYLLEVGSSRTGISLGPRVRKVSAGGKGAILATVHE
jgi:sugar lactone lactonase YvrE